MCCAYCSGVFLGWWLVGNSWVSALAATAPHSSPPSVDLEAAPMSPPTTMTMEDRSILAPPLLPPFPKLDDTLRSETGRSKRIPLQYEESSKLQESKQMTDSVVGVDVTLYIRDCR